MEMKVLFLSFVVGLGVGVLYGLIRVKSPAPPIVALLGLLGMVLGEQLGISMRAKKLDVRSACCSRLPCRRVLQFGGISPQWFSSVTARGCRAKELIVNLGEDECASTDLLLERTLRCF
jgi:XapX domain-containing protein